MGLRTLTLLVWFCAGAAGAADENGNNWRSTGGDFGKSHYSPLAHINTENISQLGFAWQYSTHTNRGLEATPIVIDGILHASRGLEVVVAAARTGSTIAAMITAITAFPWN